MIYNQLNNHSLQLDAHVAKGRWLRYVIPRCLFSGYHLSSKSQIITIWKEPPQLINEGFLIRGHE